MFERIRVRVGHLLRSTRSVINRDWRFEKRLEQAEQQEVALVQQLHHDMDVIESTVRSMQADTQRDTFLKTEQDIVKLQRQQQQLESQMQQMVRNSSLLAAERFDAAKAILAEFDEVILTIQEELLKRQNRLKDIQKEESKHLSMTMRQELQRDIERLSKEADEYKALIWNLEKEFNDAHAAVETVKVRIEENLNRLQHAYDHLEISVSADLLTENPEALSQIAHRDAKQRSANLQDMQTFQRTIKTIGKRLTALARKDMLDKHLTDDILNTLITFSDGYTQLIKVLQAGSDEDYHLLLAHLAAAAKLNQEIKEVLQQLRRLERPETKAATAKLAAALAAIPVTLAAAMAVDAKRLRGAASEVSRDTSVTSINKKVLQQAAALTLLCTSLAAMAAPLHTVTHHEQSSHAATMNAVQHYGFAAKTLTPAQQQVLYGDILTWLEDQMQHVNSGKVKLQVTVIGSADESHKPGAHERNITLYAEERAGEAKKIIDDAVLQFRQQHPGLDVQLVTEVKAVEGESPMLHEQARREAQHHYYSVPGAQGTAEGKETLDSQRFSSVQLDFEGEKTTTTTFPIPLPLPPIFLVPPVVMPPPVPPPLPPVFPPIVTRSNEAFPKVDVRGSENTTYSGASADIHTFEDLQNKYANLDRSAHNKARLLFRTAMHDGKSSAEALAIAQRAYDSFAQAAYNEMKRQQAALQMRRTGQWSGYKR